MTKPWNLLPPVQPPPELRAAVGGHPLVAQLLAQRGLTDPARARAFLDPEAYTPASPTALVGLDRAAHILHQAIRDGENILVWGDFDVDGQTSTSLLVAALQQLTGVERVRFHVPNRFSEGHGIRVESLERYLNDPDFLPDVLLTCDTGITDRAGVGLAKERGLTVVVTDHHDLGEEFAGHPLGQEPPVGESPEQAGRESVRRADAIVNPKFLPEGDPLRTLPGVGVVYKLVQRLYQLAGRPGEADQFLDLVALGIVADVAEQVHDTRYLLQRGLERLRRTQRIGLKALMDVARIHPERVDAESIGFQLGPRMNALGRLEDATVAVELLTTRDAIRAGQLAAKMERLNQQRRLLTSQITAMAFEMLERNPKLLDFNAIVLAHPNWHAGIVGIVASRLVEEYGKPAVLLLNPPGEPARGSARSVPGVDIGGAIAACSHLLLGHGGHPGAAGVTLEAEKIDAFRRELHRQIEKHRTAEGPPGLFIDAELPFQELSMSVAEQVERLAPFGNGNPRPRFLSRGLIVAEDRRVGKDGSHRRLLLQSPDGSKQPVIWFRGADVELPSGPIDFVYTLGINEYRGERSLQLGYVASRPAQQEQAIAVPGPGRAVQVHDLRQAAIRRADLPGPEQAAWYAEGTKLGEVAYHPRLELAAEGGRGGSLVLWSVPPSGELLAWLLETARPDVVYLCGQLTSDDSLEGVLKGIAGMAKYALKRDQRLPMDRLAARLGTTEAVIRHGLLWLEAKGLIRLVEWEESDRVRIAMGLGADATRSRRLLQAELDELLGEVRAYRRFFQRAGLKELGLRS